MRISVFTALILCFSILGQAQEFNVLDAKGRKQGPYKKYLEGTEQVYYTGQFKDDKPVGLFIYYYKEGPKKAEMHYRKDPDHVHTLTFYMRGGVMAEGNYISQEKDSTWNFFDEQGKVSSSEQWMRGKKHGQEKVYFPNETLGEELNWKNGLRDGVWKQYFGDGTIYLEGIFKEDHYEGQMTFYFLNGKKEITGKYVKGLRDGTWWYYNADGSVYYQVHYSMGSIVKEKRENGLFVDYGPDNIVLSEVNYKNGLKEGSFSFYHDDASFELQEVSDPLTGEKIMKEMKKGNELKMTGTYKADELHGLVRYFNTSGIKFKEERYEAGQLK